MTATETFTNQELPSDSLAPPADMNFETLSPAYKSMLLVSAAVVFTFVIVINLTVNFFVSGSVQALFTSLTAMIAIIVVTLAAGLGLLLPKLLWQSKGYQLRQHDLHYRRGVIWRHVTSLPYVRVQHVELESGPVERYFKLATLKFYTAGGGSADVSIPGLPFGTASKIRAYVMGRAGVGDMDDGADNESAHDENQSTHTD